MFRLGELDDDVATVLSRIDIANNVSYDHIADPMVNHQARITRNHNLIIHMDPRVALVCGCDRQFTVAGSDFERLNTLEPVVGFFLVAPFPEGISGCDDLDGWLIP